jgi:hypothetical protein
MPMRLVTKVNFGRLQSDPGDLRRFVSRASGELLVTNAVAVTRSLNSGQASNASRRLASDRFSVPNRNGEAESGVQRNKGCSVLCVSTNMSGKDGLRCLISVPETKPSGSGPRTSWAFVNRCGIR